MFFHRRCTWEGKVNTQQSHISLYATMKLSDPFLGEGLKKDPLLCNKLMHLQLLLFEYICCKVFLVYTICSQPIYLKRLLARWQRLGKLCVASLETLGKGPLPQHIAMILQWFKLLRTQNIEYHLCQCTPQFVSQIQMAKYTTIKVVMPYLKMTNLKDIGTISLFAKKIWEDI